MFSFDLRKEWTVRYFSNKGVYSALAENCSLGVCSHGKPHVSSHVTGEGAYFSKEKEAGESIVNEESMAFHWLSPCQEERESFFFLFGSAVVPGHVWLSLLVPQLCLIEVSV